MSKIIGITVGTTKPRANLGQTDPKKSDYIQNRPVAKTGKMTQPVGVDENGNLWTEATTTVVVGAEKPASACLWFNTSGTSGGGAETVKYTVDYRLTNCESREGATDCAVVKGSEYQDTIYAKDGYVLDTVTVTMGGSAVTVTDGTFYIASVTGDIVITATATAEETATKYTVTVDNTHGGTMFVQSRPTEIEKGGELYLQIVKQSGGNFSINITMGGIDITDTAYKDLSSGSAANSDYGTINIKNVNGNIVITVRPV